MVVKHIKTDLCTKKGESNSQVKTGLKTAKF